jgi:hypothetical protein
MDRKELYESVLNKFSTRVEEDNNNYIITYEKDMFKGECKYVGKSGMSKLQPRQILLMTETDMGDVIEFLHKEESLTSEDHNDLQMYIREHSLAILNSHLYQNKYV